jgi:hypothetical protein
MVKAVVGGRPFEFSKEEIERHMRGQEPELIREHLVEVGGRDFPPKQVIATITGWDRISFTTMEAQRVLTRAGFVCRRNGNMVLNGPKVMVPVRPSEIGRMDELGVQASRVGAALEAAEKSNQAARRELDALLIALRAAKDDSKYAGQADGS